MKAPSKNLRASLNAQNPKARAPEAVDVSMMKSGPTMTVPGEGKVAESPGTNRNHGGERSAQHYVEPMSRFGGK